MGEPVLAVKLPRRLVAQVQEQWPRLREHPAVAAMAARTGPSSAVRATLFLALADLSAGILPGQASEVAKLRAEAEQARRERDEARARLAQLEKAG